MEKGGEKHLQQQGGDLQLCSPGKLLKLPLLRGWKAKSWLSHKTWAAREQGRKRMVRQAQAEPRIPLPSLIHHHFPRCPLANQLLLCLNPSFI